MNRIGAFALGIVALSFCGLLAGCGDSGPGTAPVKGTLTIDGQPADGVTITFSPTDPARPAATGTVSNGAFQLFSGAQGKPGAVPGKYKVVLAKTLGASGIDAQKAAYAGGAKGGAKKSPAPKEEFNFPKKYASAETSDKEVEVKSGSNDIKIEISGQ